MAASVARHEVLVRGRPTEVLTLGQSINENPENIILIIPGNPGLASYYIRFMETIHASLKSTHALWTVSHAGHCHTSHMTYCPDTIHVYNLEDQIAHKIAFIQDHIPKGAKVTLVGHSIGCQIILRILKYFESNSEVAVVKNYLLFPTVERMKITPNGRRMWPMLCYFRWLVVLLTACLWLLPVRVKERLLKLYFRGRKVADCSFQATIQLFHPKVMQNVLWMAYNELMQVCDVDTVTIDKHKDNIVLYYGATDGWCPQIYRDDLKAKIEGVSAILCEDGYQHAFVLEYSEPVGRKIVNWIKT
ncbi:lipid droplet-associated hydrolase-like [Homarus americanus]|uniref:Lipid droplet-associated hydrolase-like n=1 Tax=Homarus americanus TaxID=6706 RepID=A0A8J5K451_HOMAM|nr:lipid droplet-associated hydrolase-like [Homarus americanus]KAG7168897.1 Lipid droplet-associated hydrolase-like [Homarus americanus]